jgi:hypothetical protein
LQCSRLSGVRTVHFCAVCEFYGSEAVTPEKAGFPDMGVISSFLRILKVKILKPDDGPIIFGPFKSSVYRLAVPSWEAPSSAEESFWV